MLLETREYKFEFEGGRISEISSSDFEFYYETDSDFESLYLTLPSNASCKLMEARIVNDSLVLYHVDVPSEYRHKGLGRVALSVFYFLLKRRDFTKYAIKFGGGEHSASFLESVGFEKRYIHTSDRSDFEGDSVMVGKFVSTGNRDTDWRLEGISIDTYPTDFFKF